MKPVVLQLIDSFDQGGSERQALQLTELLHAEFVIILANETGYLSAIIKPANGMANEIQKDIFNRYNKNSSDDLKINRYLPISDFTGENLFLRLTT